MRYTHTMTMHQEKWVYRVGLKEHLIQLGHDLDSGKVVILLNGEPLFVDEFVNGKPKKFSIFIDHELCEVDIERTEKEYVYKFTPCHYSTSITGKFRKKRDYFANLQLSTGIFIVFFIILIPLTVFAVRQYVHQYTTPLSSGGITTTAYITDVGTFATKTYKSAGKSYPLEGNVRYKFKVHDTWYFGDTHLRANAEGKFITHEGMPIHQNYEFAVLYAPDNPLANKILFDQPTRTQLDYFLLDARSHCVQAAPALIFEENKVRYCDCYNAKLIEQYGWEGLAQAYFQKDAGDQAEFSISLTQAALNKMKRICLGEVQ